MTWSADTARAGKSLRTDGILGQDPSDRTAISLARVGLDGGDEDRADLDRDSWRRFVEAAAGIITRTRVDGNLPSDADRVFG